MILVKLRGGLSNQMFQYAAARRLAAWHSTEVRIDTSWYDNIPPGVTPRTYELHHLQVSGAQASRWETVGTDGVRNASRSSLPLALYRKLRPRYQFIAERGFQFNPDVLDLPDNVCLFGYWISERYFSDAEDTIRQEFQFRHRPSSENEHLMMKMGQVASVAIHVRRGDYASDPKVARIFGRLPSQYYAESIDRIRSQIADPTFFVFSDDIEWAHQLLAATGDTRFQYVDHNNGENSREDLRLMSLAKHQIIANSSFSWWAAWLNTNPMKIVYAPRRWLLDQSYDTSDVLPSGWVAV